MRMRLGPIVDDDIFFPVCKTPLYYSPPGLGDTKIPHRVGIMREDTEEILHVASPDYTILHHEEVVDKARETLTRLGLAWEEDFTATLNGARLHAQFIIPSVQVDIGVGDVVNLRGIFGNSYNGTKSAVFDLGGYRLVCSNGMVVGKSLFRTRRKHVGEMDTDAMMAEVEKAILTYSDVVAPYWRSLREMEIPMVTLEEAVSTAVEDKVLPAKFSGLALEAAQREAGKDNPLNLWNVLNGFTEVTTHQVQPRSYARAEQLAHVSDNFVRGLYNDLRV